MLGLTEYAKKMKEDLELAQSTMSSMVTISQVGLALFILFESIFYTLIMTLGEGNGVIIHGDSE